MVQYSKKSGEKVKEAMHEMKEGKLKTGSGKKVTSRKQAVAIGLSEARSEGGKAPRKAASKKSATKSAVTKSAPKKSTAKRVAKKATAKGVRKSTSKKAKS